MIGSANSTLGVNPMEQFSAPMDPERQRQLMELMMLLGGLGPQMPRGQPQPQMNQMPPLLGGPVG